MKLFETLLLTLFLSSNLLGQITIDTMVVNTEIIVPGIINSDLDNYTVKVLDETIYLNDEYEESNSNIIIVDTLNSDTLSNAELNCYCDVSEGAAYELIDVNFDGFNDLIFIDDYSANSINAFYQIYLFNNERKQFSESYLTEEIGTNLDVDTVLQEISTGGSDPQNWSFHYYTYKFYDNELYLIKEESLDRIDSIDVNTNKRLYKRVRKILQDGKLIVEKELIGTFEKINSELDMWEY